MMELCPRCEHALPVMEGVPAAFCAMCGLHQVRVMADAIEPAAEPRLPATNAGSVGGVEWTIAFRVLAVGGLLGLVPSLFKPEVVAVGGGGFLTLLLLPLLTLGCAAAYLRRRPYPPFTPGIGARMGVVLALFLSGALAMLSGVGGFVLRYGMHSRTVQSNLDAAFGEFQQRMSASGTPLPPEWAAALHWPEVRAGAFLWTHLFTTLLLLAVGAIAGAVAGALLGARQRRSQR